MLSFYPAKLLGCLGDGGAVLTNSDDVYRKLILLRDHGRNQDGEVTTWGFNSRLDNIQAAYLNFQFNDYSRVINRRREMASQYHAQLSELSNLYCLLVPIPIRIIMMSFKITNEAIHRDALREFLNEHGVGTLIQWGGKAVHQFRKLGFANATIYGTFI